GVRVERANGLSVLARLPAGAIDLVFLDPPFDANLYEKALAATAKALAPEGLAYLEAPAAWNDDTLAAYGLAVSRHLKAGAVHAHLLRRAA
ncbi:MAG: 16S rRNA (guanine(966)-N(2))-methyltransferase RsmD, partial [Comamonadaceae bacterium]